MTKDRSALPFVADDVYRKRYGFCRNLLTL